jgi:hypothetical protein
MDEAALFWKLMPSRGLSSQSLPSLKKDKACISLNLCTNATRSNRLPVWLIGKAKTPWALRSVNISTWETKWR